MRSLPILATVAFALLPHGAAAQSSASASVVVNAQFGSHTSLRVSSQILRFDVADLAQPTSVAVDFSAAARTQAGGEVMLSVEPVRALEGPGGAADVESAISFAGEGDGTLTGVLGTAAPSIAGRWTGSGIRTGRLLFSLRTSAAGSYTLPVRFVLSAP